MYIFFLVLKNKMDHFRFCQLCRNCKKGSKVFKIMLNYYDENGKINLNPMERIRNFAFQCQFCCAISVVDFDQVCNASTVIEMKKIEKETKEEIEKLIADLFVLLKLICSK